MVFCSLQEEEAYVNLNHDKYQTSKGKETHLSFSSSALARLRQIIIPGQKSLLILTQRKTVDKAMSLYTGIEINLWKGIQKEKVYFKTECVFLFHFQETFYSTIT